MAFRHHPYFLTVHRLVGEQTELFSQTTLDSPPAEAAVTLQALRASLPAGFTASLTDRFGYNVCAADNAAKN